MSSDIAENWPIWEIWQTGRERMEDLEKWPYWRIMQAYEVIQAEQRHAAKQRNQNK